jgi:hypothetical protein
MARLGGETFYEEDLPNCCHRQARTGEENFECSSCGAMWQRPEEAEPEECAFTERGRGEERGAA